MVVQHRVTENARGEHQAGRLSVRALRPCAVTLVFVASGMALTLFVATSSFSFALLLLILPVAAVALAPALKYATARFRELNQRLGVWHWLLLLQFLSALVFRIRGIEEIHEATVDAWALYRITLMGVVALVLDSPPGAWKNRVVELAFPGADRSHGCLFHHMYRFDDLVRISVLDALQVW